MNGTHATTIRRPAVLGAVAALGYIWLAPPLSGQGGALDRPTLPGRADTNDWQVYYDYGVESLNARRGEHARAAFYWASRLDPRRAEPLIGQWAAAWASDVGRFERYLRLDPGKPLPAEMQWIDSLRSRALLRNPLVLQGLILVAWDLLPGRWSRDPMTRGVLAYGRGDFDRAIELFGRVPPNDLGRASELHYLRATAYVALGRIDSAAVEIERLAVLLSQHRERNLITVYDSHALLQYTRGLLDMVRGNAAAAREAFQRAVVEDLTFYAGHLQLGMLAQQERQTALALQEFARAAALGGGDVVVRYEYGAALARAGRAADAVRELQAAVALEPLWADPYFLLGEVYAAAHDTAAAVAAYSAFTARAPERVPGLARARARLAALRSSPQDDVAP